jgi:hypothetical protein
MVRVATSKKTTSADQTVAIICQEAFQPVNHHRASYPGIEFHCEHPFGPSMPFRGIEAA